jgi:hypothetical protein
MNSTLNGTVVLGFGPQTINWISDASKIAGNGAVMDPDVARMAGANLAAGTPAALDELRERLKAGALAAQRQATPGLSPAATQWLANGERGVSSNTIFSHLTGIDAGSSKSHPYDPADFRRCQLLLEQVPDLQERFIKMALVSNEWDRLVAAWPAIIAAMDDEVPGWRDGRTQGLATKAYQLIQTAIGR